MKYSITAKEPVTGVGYGLHFVEGVACTDDPAIAAKLKGKGYLVEDLDDPAAGNGKETYDGENRPPAGGDGNTGEAPEEGGMPDLQKLGRAEVDAYGATVGVDTTGAKNKPDAIAMIEARLEELAGDN